MIKYMDSVLHKTCCRVNGETKTGYAPSRMLLSDFLRESIGMTGTHVGCEHGVCGACTVLVNGVSTRSCLVFAVQVDDQDVSTVEGLSKEKTSLSSLQQAFQRHHALQCGYCTPGILISAEQFLQENSHPSESEVRDMLSGHLCRCTGYLSIVDAIMEEAAGRRQANKTQLDK